MAEGTHAAGQRGWLPMARHLPVAGAARTARSLTDAELARLLFSDRASCADSGLDTAAWFPPSGNADTARVQAAPAIALCNTCPLRSECLEFSMRYWYRGGEEGVWAGLVGSTVSRSASGGYRERARASCLPTGRRLSGRAA